MTFRVWDLPTRLFHWLLVLLVVFSVVTAKLGGNWTAWHMRSGYLILTLVVFRIVWGFIGSTPSRFAHFVRGPAAVFRYLRDTARGRAAPVYGHNPAGGYSVLLLIAAMAVQAVTGLFVDDEIANQGPLYNKVSSTVVSWATRLHHWNEKVIYAAVLLHVLAILYYTLIKKEPLLGAMIHGEGHAAPARAPAFAPVWRAVVVLLAAGGAVGWLVFVYAR